MKKMSLLNLDLILLRIYTRARQKVRNRREKCFKKIKTILLKMPVSYEP